MRTRKRTRRSIRLSPRSRRTSVGVRSVGTGGTGTWLALAKISLERTVSTGWPGALAPGGPSTIAEMFSRTNASPSKMCHGATSFSSPRRADIPESVIGFGHFTLRLRLRLRLRLLLLLLLLLFSAGCSAGRGARGLGSVAKDTGRVPRSAERWVR